VVTEPNETPSPEAASQGEQSQPEEEPSAGAGSESSAGEQQTESDPLAEAKAEAARLRDQLIRTAADFDNFRKRTRRESVEAELRGRESFLKEILPVFDNLERAVSHAELATDVQSLLNGIQMVKRQFTDTLARQGIERVPTVGAQFDPTVHEAIQHLETDERPPGVIASEIQPGYIAQKRLIRPALVVVAKAKAQNGAKESVAPKAEPTTEETVTFDEPEIEADGEDNRD